MRSVAPMRIAKSGYLAMSVLLLLLGILLIAWPGFSLEAVGVCCGIGMLAFGIIKLVGYFSKDLFRLAFENDLASGILMLALGGSLLLHTEASMTFFCTVFGILILTDGLFKVQIAVEAKPFGIRLWWLILMTAVLTAVFGIALIFRPSESLRLMTVLLGAALIWDGVLNFSTMLTAVKIIRGQHPDEE